MYKSVTENKYFRQVLAKSDFLSAVLTKRFLPGNRITKKIIFIYFGLIIWAGLWNWQKVPW